MRNYLRPDPNLLPSFVDCSLQLQVYDVSTHREETEPSRRISQRSSIRLFQLYCHTRRDDAAPQPPKNPIGRARHGEAIGRNDEYVFARLKAP